VRMQQPRGKRNTVRDSLVEDFAPL
jgi:hypothetical protein